MASLHLGDFIIRWTVTVALPLQVLCIPAFLGLRAVLQQKTARREARQGFCYLPMSWSDRRRGLKPSLHLAWQSSWVMD